MAERASGEASGEEPDVRGPDQTETETGQDAGRVDIAAVRQLLELMEAHDLAEIEIEQEELAVRLRKAGPAGAVPMTPVPAQPAVPAAGGADEDAGSAAEEDEGLVTIDSPMVGTFYDAPSPEADVYVNVGDHVTEESVVGMVEAMKVFNEIRAEVSGTIEKVLTANAEAVEFGQALFAVRPD
jgi:acetyl-CoA carboxylase biotin carboxyl carrier protein